MDCAGLRTDFSSCRRPAPAVCDRSNRSVFLLLGVALLVRTLQLGGGEVGFLAAAVFLALGVLRLRAAR